MDCVCVLSIVLTWISHRILWELVLAANHANYANGAVIMHSLTLMNQEDLNDWNHDSGGPSSGGSQKNRR